MQGQLKNELSLEGAINNEYRYTICTLVLDYLYSLIFTVNFLVNYPPPPTQHTTQIFCQMLKFHEKSTFLRQRQVEMKVGKRNFVVIVGIPRIWTTYLINFDSKRY